MDEREFGEELREENIDILELLEVLWKNKLMIGIVSLFCAIAFFIGTEAFKEDTYTAQGIMHVGNRSQNMMWDSSASASDIMISKELSMTYIQALRTRTFLESVSEEIGGMYSWGQINSMMRVSMMGETELMSVAVTAPTPDAAFIVCNAVISKIPAKFQAIYDSCRVSVMDKVHKPVSPDGKGSLKQTMIGFILGFVLSAGFVLVRWFFDKKVHSASDITKKYDISVLGRISPIDPISQKMNKLVKKEQTTSRENIINDNTDFNILETYKSIRTNIMFSLPKTEHGKVIAVTSAAPGEGKTTTTTNLAITFAQTGARVLLIDCDLRCSRIHRYLGIKRDKGVSNVLCGFASLDEAVVKNVCDNLDVLTAGEIPPNPSELLVGAEFEKTIKEAQERYDYVLIDTPPTTVVADASIIMRSCQGVVVIVRENSTTFDILDETIDTIRRSKVTPIGVVVLDSKEERKKYRYYGGERYSYRNYNYYYKD